LGAQLREIEVTGRSDDGVDLLQRRHQCRSRHEGECRFAHGIIFHRFVHQHVAGTAELKGGGIEVTDGAQPGQSGERFTPDPRIAWADA
jgi:hypothetical protein